MWTLVQIDQHNPLSPQESECWELERVQHIQPRQPGNDLPLQSDFVVGEGSGLETTGLTVPRA